VFTRLCISGCCVSFDDEFLAITRYSSVNESRCVPAIFFVLSPLTLAQYAVFGCSILRAGPWSNCRSLAVTSVCVCHRNAGLSLVRATSPAEQHGRREHSAQIIAPYLLEGTLLPPPFPISYHFFSTLCHTHSSAATHFPNLRSLWPSSCTTRSEISKTGLWSTGETQRDLPQRHSAASEYHHTSLGIFAVFRFKNAPRIL
jgi:hypothetical protein